VRTISKYGDLNGEDNTGVQVVDVLGMHFQHGAKRWRLAVCATVLICCGLRLLLQRVGEFYSQLVACTLKLVWCCLATMRSN
jgi:hypothetical protein